MNGNRIIVAGTLLTLCAIAGHSPWSHGSAVRRTPVQGMRFEEYGRFHYAALFEGRESAHVIVSGSRSTGYLGLYVYDSQGSCTAMDDVGDYQTRNDLAVEWYAATRAVYEIEIVNHSNRIGEFNWVVR